MNAVGEIAKDATYWVEWQLENWARWMHGGERPMGLPRQACAGEGYTTLDVDNERAYGKLDAWAAKTTGAAIDDLSPVEQAAICHCYLQAVYRFNREDYAVVLVRAKRNVMLGLRRRGVWLGE